MKKFYFPLLMLATVFCIGSCKNKTTTTEEPEIPADGFSRKHLIEHFTGEECGYCPYGMDMISAAMSGKESSYVWISNHAGYSDDEFTIADSKKIAKLFGVNAAPMMMLNRQDWQYTDEEGNHRGKVFHPYYMQQFTSKLEDKSPVSIEISNEFDAATNTLTITVSGQATDPALLMSLTVCLTESGLHGVQADYYNTWAGWSDFVHCNVVRSYITNYKGDPVAIQAKNAYSASYSIQWKEEWKADNAMVIAYLTEDADGMVLNVEEKPVVEGTKGGKDFKHEGVTRIDVPDTYPETDKVPEEGANPVFTQGGYYDYASLQNGLKVVCIQLMSNKTVTYNMQETTPFALMFVVVKEDEGGLPQGVYEFKSTLEEGSAWAGGRDEEHYEILGSSYFLANTEYLSQGYIYGSRWLMAKGNITITGDELIFETVSLNTSKIRGTFKGTLGNYNEEEAPRKAPVRRAEDIRKR